MKQARHSWWHVKKRSLHIALAVLFVGVLGLTFMAASHAATSSKAVEAEDGTLSPNAVAVQDSAASGGKAVRFAPSDNSSAKPVLANGQLQRGIGGARLKMDGVTVWGVKDEVTGDFGADQYANRQKIIQTIKAWGGNHVRFRLLASNYDSQSFMTKAEYLKQIKEWRDLTVAAGMYFMPIWWDGLDGAYGKGNWATQYSKAFPMMTDVVNALGNDPMVLYEPFNEPTDAPSDDQWFSAMKATVGHFRNTLNYTGVLVLDTRVWSHYYDDARMTQLEQYDATLSGMGGRHQLVFAKHDYANEGYANPDSGFDSGHWAANGNNWNFSKHATWETEFGNYNGDPSSVHIAWSQGAASWMAAKVNDGTLVGASGFVWGPWYDANAITNADNTTPTTWGGYVKNNLLGAIN